MHHALYESIFRASTIGMALVTPEGTIVEMNPAFEQLARADAASELPDSIFDLIHSVDRSASQDRFDRLCDSGERYSWLARSSVGKRAAVWQLDVSVADRTAPTPLLLVSARDVTLQRYTERRLKNAKEAAERATETKSAFLANMSHEIRTPIHTITGMNDLLLDTELDGEQREYAQQVRTSAEVLLYLINDILDFSKIEAGRLSLESIEFNLVELVEESVDMVSVQAHRKGLETVVSLAAGLAGSVMGDPGRVRQIIVNLVNNAIKFTSTGAIEVSVAPLHSSIDGDDRGGSGDAGEEITRVRVEVTDTGIGIPAEKLPALFAAFRQVDSSTTRRFGGTGLGLSISKSLVEMMHGEIGVESREGEGSTFWFELPLHVVTPEPPVACDLTGRRILLIDDNATATSVVDGYLRRMGAETVTVSSGQAGIQALRDAADDAPFDLALIDLELPGMDGWQLASEINADKSVNATALILMSPTGLMAGEAKMKRLRWFNGYVSKPVSFRALNAEIDAALSEAIELLPAEEVDEPVEEAIPVTARILVAEDHLVNQQLFRTILTKLGHDVVLAADGREALEAAESGHVDLVFMDVQMPEMNGYEATTELRRRGFKQPIIAVTANAVKGEREKCIGSGMNDFLPKPFRKEDIVKVIDRWLTDQVAVLEEVEELEAGDSYGDPGFLVPEEILGRPISFVHAPVFDPAAALERFMGQRAVVERVIADFARTNESQLDQLPALIEHREFTAIRGIAHAMKGGAWSLEAMRLGNVAALLEASAKMESIERCRHYAESLRVAFHEYADAIRQPVFEETGAT